VAGKNVRNFHMALCNRVGEMNQQKSMYVMSKHLWICLNFHLKRFHISHDTSEIVLQVIKQCLHVCNEHRNHQITTEIGFRRSWWLVKVVLWNGKIFFIDPQKTKVNQKTYIDYLKTSLLLECHRLYPDNDFVFVQDSAPSHTAPKQPQIFLETTRPISLAHKNGHRIRQIWICWITQFGISCKNLSTKEGVNHLRISKIFRMLSETYGTMSMTRQSEKLYCSGKGV